MLALATFWLIQELQPKWTFQVRGEFPPYSLSNDRGEAYVPAAGQWAHITVDGLRKFIVEQNTTSPASEDHSDLAVPANNANH